LFEAIRNDCRSRGPELSDLRLLSRHGSSTRTSRTLMSRARYRPKFRLPSIVRCGGLLGLEAVPAKNRLAWRWIERHFGLLAAFRTRRRIQLSWSGGIPATIVATRGVSAAVAAIIAIAAGGISTASARVATTAARIPATARRTAIGGISAARLRALRLAGLTTCRASLRIRESSLLIKFLLTCREHEFLAAVAAGQRSFAHSD
jgi:hypothetical protein